ncbi:hypothetical protein D9M71_774080 [compost metagenome]
MSLPRFRSEPERFPLGRLCNGVYGALLYGEDAVHLRCDDGDGVANCPWGVVQVRREPHLPTVLRRVRIIRQVQA